MDQMRQFGSMLCVAAVGCCALRMLLPENKLEPVLKVMLSAFFLLCLFAPLRSFSLPDYDPRVFYGETAVRTEKLTDLYERQLAASAQDSLSRVIDARLQKMGINGTNIQINIHAKADGRIDISEVELVLPQDSAAMKQRVADYITGELELPCTVTVDGEVQDDGA